MTRLDFPTSPPAELATIGDWWRFAFTHLETAAVEFGQGTLGPSDDASFLILGALNLPLNSFDTFKGYAVTNAEKALLFDALRQRCVERIPSAYVLGFTEQCGYRFLVNESVLIPRSYLGDLLVKGLSPWVSDRHANLSVLDLCTGSGCLAIIAAHELENSLVYASDISADALAVAGENVDAHDLSDVIDLREGDLFAPWSDTQFDVILSNPPYVTDESMEGLPPEFEREPALALAAGMDGCDVLHRLLAEAPARLNPSGLLFVDVGHNRLLVEAAFPHLPFTWISTNGTEDGVFLLSAEDFRQ